MTEAKNLPEILKGLIGKEFKLTGKTRTDGSNLRKLIANELFNNGLPEGATENEFEIVPPRKKGVPKMLRELIDTYIVTSGTSYNLQVWNRIPNCNTVLVKYDSGASLLCNEERYVFAKIDRENCKIASIIILTADYIEAHFGKFGKPTIKHQLLISSKARNQIYSSENKVLSFHDSSKLSYYITDTYDKPNNSIANEPNLQNLYSIGLLVEMVAKKLIGRILEAMQPRIEDKL